jgi:hypothetical protein
MLEKNLSPLTIHVRLSAVRKLNREAGHNGILDVEQAAQVPRLPNPDVDEAEVGSSFPIGSGGSSTTF